MSIDCSRLPTIALATGRQKKRWIDCVKEDLEQRGSDVRQAADCVKDRKQRWTCVHAAPSSAVEETNTNVPDNHKSVCFSWDSDDVTSTSG